jgi:hypothetical protein
MSSEELGRVGIKYDTHTSLKGIVTHVGFEVLSRVALAPEDSFASTFSTRSRPMASSGRLEGMAVCRISTVRFTQDTSRMCTFWWLSLTDAEGLSEPECAPRLTLCEDDASRSS